MPPRQTTPLPSRYRDARHLAHGGMGEIFRAKDEELGRDVAIKVLSERYAEDDELRRRFRREALAAARLSGNPNIVTIYDVGEHEGRPLIVMEYLPGGSLERRVGGKAPCPPAQVLDWLEESASALEAAHAAGVVHRDVKPGNLLLDDRDHVHVADFGIASAAGFDSMTQTGTILGTAGYLSPEQAQGQRATAASDRYALAVVAWELLTGKRPFASESPTAEAAAHIHAPVPPIHEANPRLPRAFDGIFRRALAKDPGARYASAAEFVGELRRALHDAAADTWVAAAPAWSPPPAAPAPAAPRRRGFWIPLLAALLVAAGIAAAVAATHRGGGRRTAPPKPTTIVRTVTGAGVTVQETVTAPAPPPETTSTAAAPPPTTAPATGDNGVALNDAGYAKMQAGDFRGALPLLQQAVANLQGSGSIAEAYADYNLAYTRYALGDCTDVIALLDHSEQIQGKRPEIDKLRRDATKSGC